MRGGAGRLRVLAAKLERGVYVGYVEDGVAELHGNLLFGLPCSIDALLVHVIRIKPRLTH